MPVYIEKKWIFGYHGGTDKQTTKRIEGATQPLDHGRLRCAPEFICQMIVF